MINNLITVKNCDNETKAEIITQNKIEFIPKVSVVIPVYNVELYLRQCLDSVINQTLKDIEIICVDDGSTDNSLSILKEYAEKDNRITVLSQQNLHAGVARNAGLAVAKGEYLSFLDSDDFFELNMLEELYGNALKYNSDIVICQYTNYNEQTKRCEIISGINKNYARFNPDVRFLCCNPMPWNKLFKRTFILGNSIFYQSLQHCNDVYFTFCSLACTSKISFLQKSLMYYRYNRQTSLKNNRDKNPLCFYDAYHAVYQFLLKNDIYEKYKKTFLNSLVSSSLWTLENTFKTYSIVKEFIKNTIIPEFSLLDKNLNLLMKNYVKKLQRICDYDIIVSLTSYPARINTVHLTLKSILEQSLKADKVILWLSPEQFPNKEKDLPKQLLDLCDKGLTIDWYHDIKSYKKLIPTLKKYPEAIIVTADDDLIFDPDWLKLLYDSYVNAPENIHCHRITRLFIGGTKLKVLHRKLTLMMMKDTEKNYVLLRLLIN